MALPVRLVDVAEGNGDLVVSAAGVSATERLVCFVDTDAGGGGGAVADWSLLDDDGAGADLGFCYARDELGPGGGSHTFNIAGGADGAAMLIAVDGSPSVDDAAAATGTGTTMAASSVTPGDATERQLVVWWKTWSHVDETDATITTPGGMTVIADDVASGAGWGRRSIATEAVGAGATGTRTATSSPGNRWVALSVALSAEGDADPAQGTAAAGIGIALAAAGARDSGGTGEAGVGLALAATGARQSAGAGSAGLRLTFAAAGGRESAGSGSLGIGLELRATGARPSLGAAALRIGLRLASGQPVEPSATPAWRTVVVPAESRVVTVRAESRTLTVAREERTHVVEAHVGA